jgi:pyruvate,water dikinase
MGSQRKTDDSFAEPWKKEKSIGRNGRQKLVQGENGLEVYVMIEIPSNVILADEFASFDGSVPMI